tara:strand:- start:9356 stop:10237 length:882 start_codon:yes stop_codon:yes gene_type:complete
VKRKRIENPTRFQDFMSMTKPSITGMCVLMAGGGYWLAPGLLDIFELFYLLIGTTLIVAGSCVLNMYFERHHDKKMARTSHRPLPSGRIEPKDALMFALFCSLSGFLILGLLLNWLTAFLGAAALVSYVFVYTPMKRRSWTALLIGTIPGAMPPLMGWTAFTGQIQWPGVVLFLMMVVWQIPHFIALSLMLKNDYEKAGIKTLPASHGDWVAKLQALGYTLVLLPLSLALVPMRMAGLLYFCVALALGVWFAFVALKGVIAPSRGRLSHQLFFASLIYLPVLSLGLVVDLLVL